MSTSLLLRIPREILERIALEVALLDPVGLPLHLTPLRCTCRDINNYLAVNNCPDLYARIFRGKFDVGAARRRFGPTAAHSSHLASQLRNYLVALKLIRDGDIYSPHIIDTFWSAFLMLIENDGKNRLQLEWAGIEDFVDRFVRTRLGDGRIITNGWPAESALNTLALWVMWLTTSRENLVAESEQRRQQIVEIVLPYVILGCRYPSTYAPPNHYQLPLREDIMELHPGSVLTAHGPYPIYRDPNDIARELTHYGIKTLIGLPLITIAAKLIYFSRREVVPIGIPPHLPLNRAHAIQLGRTHVAPTQEDVIEFNSHKHAKLSPITRWDWRDSLTAEDLAVEKDPFQRHRLKAPSAQWDDDFTRWRSCWDPWNEVLLKGSVYTAGMLNGLWQGRMLVPNEPTYVSLISMPEMPPNFSERHPFVTTVPLYMRLREHHCINPQVPVLPGGEDDGFDEGLANAWLPRVRLVESDNTLKVEDNEGNTSIYETHQEGRPNSHDENRCSMCIARRAGRDELAQVQARSMPMELEEDFQEAGLGRESSQEDDDDYTEEPCRGIEDILLTGETDYRHGQAWNHFKFYGRVRTWDGLICLIRVPLMNPTLVGRWVFTGYITGGQNFVGTWRAMSGDVGMPTWESAFAVSKRE